MANKRMFSLDIVDSDAFLEMPPTARLLYFEMGMRADDEGFVNGPRKIMRISGATEEDMNILTQKGFIIPFDSGIVVIKHWRINNQIRKDRFKPTRYQEELSTISIKENGAYTLSKNPVNSMPEHVGCQNDNQVTTKWQPNGNQMATQDSIGEDSIGEDRSRTHGKFNNVYLTDEELADIKMHYYASTKLINQVSAYLANTDKTYTNHAALIYKIAEEDGYTKKPKNYFEEAEVIKKPEEDPEELRIAREEAMESIRKSIGGIKQ